MNKNNGFIYDNLKTIVDKKYITVEELRFIFIVKELVDKHLNAIMNIEQNTFFNISELSEAVSYKVDYLMSILDSLVKKGIIHEFVNRKTGENIDRDSVDRKRTLFINPELYYRGDINRISPVLISLIKSNDIIETNNIYLPKKVIIKSGDIFGRLKDRVNNKR